MCQVAVCWRCGCKAVLALFIVSWAASAAVGCGQLQFMIEAAGYRPVAVHRPAGCRMVILSSGRAVLVRLQQAGQLGFSRVGHSSALRPCWAWMLLQWQACLSTQWPRCSHWHGLQLQGGLVALERSRMKWCCCRQVFLRLGQ